MKNQKTFLKVLSLFLFSMTTKVYAETFETGIVIKPITLQVRALDSGDKLSDFVVDYKISCRYRDISREGYAPLDVDCGRSTTTIPVSAQGIIQLPAVHMFPDTIQLPGNTSPDTFGDNKNHYHLSILLRKKKDKPVGTSYYFAFEADGETEIYKVENFKETIYFGTLDGGEVTLTEEGRPLLGSALAQNPNSNVSVFLEVVTPPVPGYEPYKEPKLGSAQGDRLAIRIGNQVDSFFTTPTFLRDATKLEIQGGPFAFAGDPAKAKLVLRAVYAESSTFSYKNLYGGGVESKVERDFLKKHNSVDMKPLPQKPESYLVESY